MQLSPTRVQFPFDPKEINYIYFIVLCLNNPWQNYEVLPTHCFCFIRSFYRQSLLMQVLVSICRTLTVGTAHAFSIAAPSVIDVRCMFRYHGSGQWPILSYFQFLRIWISNFCKSCKMRSVVVQSISYSSLIHTLKLNVTLNQSDTRCHALYYSDDSLIRTRLFRCWNFRINEFSGLLNRPSPDVSELLIKRT